MAPSISTSGHAGGRSEASAVSTSERPAYDSTEPRCPRADEVLMMPESANFDEAVFTDPDEPDIGADFDEISVMEYCENLKLRNLM